MSSVDGARRRSLAGTLFAWFVAAAILLVLLTAGLLHLALVRGMAWRDDQVLLTRADTLLDLLHAATIDTGELDLEVSEDLEGPRQLFVRIVAPAVVGRHETPKFPSDLTADRFPDASTAAPDKVQLVEIDIDGRVFRSAVLRTGVPAAGGGWATIQMAMDTSLDEEVVDRYTEYIVLVIALVSALGILIGRWIVQWNLLPLRTFAAEANKIDQSALDRRISLGGLPAELNDFALQFNRMVARLEEAYRRLRSYADDVAHELRTPLNRIHLGAEVALKEPRTPEAYREVLESTLDECDHLNEVVKALLFLANADNGAAQVFTEEFRVADRLEKTRTFFETSATEAGVSLRLACDPALSVKADATLFQRAVNNVVANALAHTPAGGTVSIDAKRIERFVVIEIADTGEGIAARHLPHVFDRFFRGDAPRRNDSDRVGLGLAIAKAIVDLHGGRISLESDVGSGTRFFLHFPAA